MCFDYGFNYSWNLKVEGGCMQKKEFRFRFILCLILLTGGCSTHTQYNPKVEIRSRHQAFNLQKGAGIKMVVLPVRDFSDHFGFGYSATVMNTFVQETGKKFPKLEVIESQKVDELLKNKGKRESYKLFIDKCITKSESCAEQTEILNLFKDSGVNYVVIITIGTLNIPIPGNMMAYYLSAVIYDIERGGEVVFNAFSEDEFSPDSEDNPAQFLTNVMQQISRVIVAKM